MRLSLQTFSSLVQNMAASVEASATQLLDLTAGSALRAVLEANASIGLWMQWLIVLVLQTTRASTSTGADLDSWMADFAFARLPAAPATGTVTFSRYTPGVAAFIPVGALVRTSDGAQTFSVAASAGNTAFSAAANGYAVPAESASLDVPVVALSAGVQGNILPGTVTLLATAVQGIDTVVNAAGMQNGLDAESDAAARTRFQMFIDTRSRATSAAVAFAIASVQQGLSFTLQENVDASGSPRPGSFLVAVDDGSGAPSTALLASVQGAIETVRPVGSAFAVRAPTVVSADIAATLAIGTGTASADVIAAAAAAITRYASTLPLGGALSASKVAAVAYGASPTITNVIGVKINGAAADLECPATSVIKAASVAVS